MNKITLKPSRMQTDAEGKHVVIVNTIIRIRCQLENLFIIQFRYVFKCV